MKIIIPAYQPNNKLLQLIETIQLNSDYGIILVDDGSSKECKPIFNEAEDEGCIVLTHEENKGKGAALKTAFTYALASDETDGLICADCDGQHTWQDIKQIANALPEHSSSVILGCRKFTGTVPLKSMLGNKITRSIFYLISGNWITDTQTGLRGFSAKMLPWLVKLQGNRYEYEMNQLLEAKKAGYNFYSIPIDTLYENNNEGSHFHPIKDSIRVYLPILKFSMSSITCGLLDFFLLFLLNRLSGSLLFSVIAARIISSLCNYLLNKNVVFQAKDGRHLTTLIQYYLLAAGILTCNYLLLSFLNNSIGLSLFISKLITEGALFSISYFLQHKIIFRKQSE